MDWVLDGLSRVDGVIVHAGPALTLAITIALLVSGVIFLFAGDRPHVRELGVGLVVGSLFGLGSYANQVTVQASDFRSSLTMTKDLTGFDPGGRSLQGFSLSGKTFNRAFLSDADMRGANLSYAQFREADLTDARLTGARLFYATFLRAALRDADLRRADLRGAEVSTTGIGGADLAGAKVHAETCWHVPLADVEQLEPTVAGGLVLDRVVGAGLVPSGQEDALTLGHVCDRQEMGSTGPDLPAAGRENRVFICAEPPHLSGVPCTARR